MDLQKINELLGKYGEGKATESEIEELNQWYRLTAYQDGEFPESEEAAGKEILKRLNSKTRPVGSGRISFRWLAAASIIVVLGITGLFVSRVIDNNKQSGREELAGADILPGGNKAVLTLANGKRISLSETGNGQIAKQEGLSITKAANGQLVYRIIPGHGNSNGQAVSRVFNTIETPKGGQYQVLLPDGSKVWLNAYSSLKFPLGFEAGRERRVELSGEAYFEVAHREKQPFKVVTARQMVEVLGTHFNVNSYADDAATRTTLLEGSVRVSTPTMSATLVPGQQAALTDKFEVRQVSTEECVAWKNGFFKFDEAKLEDIMRSISRWYDVEVIFQDTDLKKETFGAVTTRFANIDALLKMIEQTGDAHFTVHGKTIIVSNKK